MRGKTIIVTGAGSIGPGMGNGKASSIVHAREGGRVLLVDRDLTAAKVHLTDAYGGDVDEMRSRWARLCPMGEQGDAWDTAHPAVFLASEDARYITGTTLTVDGGLSAVSPR